MMGIDDAALALALSAGVSTAGQLYANRANRKAQQAINDQALNVAAINNATQIDMANTAHQREVADLRKAGLNPILSAGGSGASVPQLSAPNLGTPKVDNPVSDAAHSAGQLSRYVGSSLANLKADTEVKENTAENLATQNTNLDAQRDLYKAQAIETLSRADLHKVEKDYPGMTGQIYRAMRSLGRDLSATYGDIATNATQAAKGWVSPTTWSSPSRQAVRRYGTGDGSSVEVKYETPRMRHETSKHQTPPRNRKHN